MSDYNKFKSVSHRDPTYSHHRPRRSRSPEEDYRGDQRSSRRDSRSPVKNRREEGNHRRSSRRDSRSPMKDRREESNHRRSNSSNKSRNSRSDSRSRSRSPIKRRPQFIPGKVPQESGHCFNCGEYGHWKGDCPANNSRNRREHTFDRREKSFNQYDSRNRRERNPQFDRNNDSTDRTYRQPYKKQDRNQTTDPGINASNGTRDDSGYRLDEKPCQSTNQESFKAPRYNAHNETRAAIMAMMESMNPKQTSITGEPKRKNVNERKSKNEYFDENDNVCNKKEAKTISEDHDRMVLEIIDSLISEFFKIIWRAPRDKLPINDAGESNGKETPPPTTQSVKRESEMYNTTKSCPTQNNDILKDPRKIHTNNSCGNTKREMPHPESPGNKQSVTKKSIIEGQNSKEPRKEMPYNPEPLRSDLKNDLDKFSSATNPSLRGMPLKEQLLCQGVPEDAFSQNDGFTKMQMVFCGRVGVVKKQPINICEQVAESMIDCCEHAFHGYSKLADQYVKARIEHIQRSRRTGYFPEEDVSENDMSTVPPLLELRHEWHRQLINEIGKHTKVPFRYSELVDLVMYYFNHIAWKESRTKPWKHQGNY